MFRIWRMMSFLNNVAARRVSGAITVAVPILAITFSWLENRANGSSDYFNVVAQFIIGNAALPIGVMRVFWLSLSVYIATLIFNATCPSIVLLSREEWQKSAECSSFVARLIKKHPDIVRAEITNRINKFYDSKQVELLDVRNIALSALVPLIFMSCYLSFIIFTSQVMRVLPYCSWTALLSINATSCQ